MAITFWVIMCIASSTESISASINRDSIWLIRTHMSEHVREFKRWMSGRLDVLRYHMTSGSPAEAISLHLHIADCQLIQIGFIVSRQMASSMQSSQELQSWCIYANVLKENVLVITFTILKSKWKVTQLLG